MGFKHMHERGILHQVCAECCRFAHLFTVFVAQDFKPANLMLHSDGMVKITDFGAFVCCARSWGGKGGGGRSVRDARSRAGLAKFSHQIERDPWTEDEVYGGLLAAHFEGGTPLTPFLERSACGRRE